MNGRTCYAILVLSAIPGLMPLPISATWAQDGGFSEIFDHAALPGWEHSPNAVTRNGTLRIEPGGFAFRPGPWDNFLLILRAQYGGEGRAIISYRVTDKSEYTLQLGPGFVSLSRAGQQLGQATHEIPPGEWAALEISSTGGSQAIKLNGRAVISVVDPNPLTAGGLFLRADAAAAEFDDLTLQPAVSTRPPAYQAKSWVSMGGPPGDLGYDIRYNFNDHKTWYVTDGQGGFFISTDRGLTWKASNKGIASLEGTILRPVFSATVDPHSPQTIWIGTQLTGHIYKSTDGGQNWVQKDKGVTPNQGHHFRGFTVDPISSDIVYAQAEVDCSILSAKCPPLSPGILPPVGGRIYRTSDGGENWSLIWEGDALARYLWIDPSNVNVLYVSTGIFDRVPMDSARAGVGVLKSTDGGQTWRVLGRSNGLTNLYVGSLYMHPQNPQILLAGAGISNKKVLDPETGKDVLEGGVFLTTDGGEHWTKVIKNDAFGAVEFCDQNPMIAYAAGQMATYRSEDGGHTWQKFGDEQRETWGPRGVYPGLPIDLQTDPDDCSRVFLNNYIGGNFLSTDGGKTWSIATTGYSGAQVYDVSVDPQNAAHIYATTRMAPFVSYDGGTTWAGMSDEVIKTSLNSLTVDPSNANHLLGSQGRTNVISFDGGRSWQAFEQFKRPADLTEGDAYWMAFGDFAFAPSDSMIVYAASRNDASFDSDIIMKPTRYSGLGIYRSADGGTTWQPANDSSTASEGFAAVLVHTNNPQIVYAAAHYDVGVFKTTNGGRTWTPVNNGLPQPYERFYTMAMDPDSPDTIILLGKAGVFKTTTGGTSWRQLTRGVDPGSTCKAVVYDPTDGRIVYLGSTRLGVFYSTDSGETFQPLTQGLDTSLGGLPVKHLGISADGSVLYAATHGSGVWRLGAPSITAEFTPSSATAVSLVATPRTSQPSGNGRP